MRLVKLLNRSEGIRNLLWTFIKSFQVGQTLMALLYYRFIFIITPQGAGLLWFVSPGSTSRSPPHRDALLYLRRHRDAGTGPEYLIQPKVGKEFLSLDFD